MSQGTKKQQHYNLLKLTKGQLGLYIKGKKKSAVTLNGNLNDGQWHDVNISKKKRKVTILLDGEQRKTVKVPKTTVKNEIYLGGIPQHSNYLQITDLVRKIQLQISLRLTKLYFQGEFHSFRGCLRSVFINKEEQLSKTKDVSHSNTGQCFSNIEEGAYFNGSAFAIFSKSTFFHKFTLDK